ncbi:hypothetical protein T02_4099 [Trichinella nativa]|uniref:Uncharacterized protein n=1 Tax=Trichinella nativa TaxID=6335 RepID=A0A0V1KKR4_9BILA|nr:hypothetical protein T02_4099 [Trichinella nativa]
MLALTVNSGSKMLGPSTNKMFPHNFIVFLITTAVCYQVAVTWAMDNTALGKNGVLYDKQNQTETMTKNISNQYLPKENDQNNNKINVKETVFETSIEKENITEFVIKAPLTPITLTPETMTPIPTNFSEKVEPTNNRSKEHTDEILNMVNAGKTNGSGVELIETLPPNSINHEEFYGNKTVSEISTAKKSDAQASVQKFNQITPQMKMLMENVTNVVNGSKTYGNDNVFEKLKAGKTNGSGVEFIETPPPNFVTTSTSTPIICTQMVNYKGKNREFCIGMSITFIALTIIAILCLCVFHIQPMKMLRSIIERRRNGENHRNFCISTRAEQEMVSFGEKAE